jgi:hypothetical protein
MPARCSKMPLVRPIATLLLLLAAPAFAAWVPPADPNPQRILGEAREDRATGRYADALAKHVWFHENAVKMDAELSAVRRTSALVDWRLLNFRYEPGTRKLREIRDLSAARVMKGEGDVRNLYLDVAAISEALEDEPRTRQLFLWLDKNNAALAREVYPRTQPLLVRSGDVALCGKYIDPPNALKDLVTSFRTGLRLARRSVGGDVDIAQLQFTSEATLLVALLAANKRRPEAQKTADEALRVVNNVAFEMGLKKALTGEIPDIGPSEGLRALLRAWERTGNYIGM